MNRASKPWARVMRGAAAPWLVFGALLPILALAFALFAGSSAAAEDPSSDSGSTLSIYEVSVSQRNGRQTSEEKFTLEVFELPAEKKQRHIVFVAYSDPEGAALKGLPIGAVELRKKNEIRVSLTHPMERAPIDAVVSIVEPRTTVPATRLAEAGTGTARIELRGLRLDKRIPVKYETKHVAAGDGQRVEYAVTLDAGPIISDFGRMHVELQDLKQRMVFAGVGGRLIEGSWDHRAVHSFGGSLKSIKSRLIEITEKSHRALTKAEAFSVWDEYRELLPLARAVLPGHVSDAKKSDFEDILRNYVKKNPEGLLKAAVGPLQIALDAKLVAMSRSLDPDVRAKGLMNKTAPDFTLEDLEGNEITISKLKGRVVLVSFWSWA